MTTPSPQTRWARFYVGLGWQPLPSRPIHGRPVSVLPAYAHYRDGEPGELDWLDRWPGPLIQLALGARWGVCVLDCDGPDALEEWGRWQTRGREWRETWTVESRAGRHYYYALPPGTVDCPSKLLWQGERKHSELRLLGDRSLVTAPPSRHPKPPRSPYRFLAGRGPDDLELAVAPAWLRGVPPWDARPKVARVTAPVSLSPGGTYRDLASIPPGLKLALARSWGLRTVHDGPNRRGWVACHAVDRDDVHPSASLHLESGVFWQAGARSESFAGLAVRLGAFPDLRAAFQGLGIGERS